MKNTYQEFELVNGEKVKLTLNFLSLLKIKNKHTDLYNDFMRIMQGEKDFDIIYDCLKVIYISYLCANIETDNYLSEEEFIEKLPFDIEKINLLVSKMMMAGK